MRLETRSRSGRTIIAAVTALILTGSIYATAQPEAPPTPASKEWTINRMEGAPQACGYRWFAVDGFNNELHALYFHATAHYTPNYLIYCYSPDNGVSWTFDTIDGSTDTMAHVDNLYSMATFNGAIAVDRCGVPHLFYTVNYFYDNQNKPSWAIHAQKIDGQWIRDTVEARGSGESMINFDVDMVIGSDNEPRVVYIHGESEPMFGRRADGVWKLEPVSGVGVSRYLWNSLALDSRNVPHILLGKFSELEYATKTEEGWKVAHLFSDVNGIGDIVTDRKNTPHITYNHPIASAFRHAVPGTGEWESSAIESFSGEGSANGKRARIKTDWDGTLHAVYYGHNGISAQESIIYAYSTDNGKTWKEEIVEYVGNIYVEGSYPDLVVTENLIGLFYKGEGDIPHFAYRQHSKPNFHKSKPNNCGQ